MKLFLAIWTGLVGLLLALAGIVLGMVYGLPWIVVKFGVWGATVTLFFCLSLIGAVVLYESSKDLF